MRVAREEPWEQFFLFSETIRRSRASVHSWWSPRSCHVAQKSVPFLTLNRGFVFLLTGVIEFVVTFLDGPNSRVNGTRYRDRRG